MSTLVEDVRCRICGVPVNPATGAGIRLRRRTYAVCEEHAPIVRAAGAGARELFVNTTRAVLKRHAPQAFKSIQTVFRLYDSHRRSEVNRAE